MKICFVVHTFDKRDRGGVLRVVSQLANLLCKEYVVEILSIGRVNERSYDLNPNVILNTLDLDKHNTVFYKGLNKINWFKETYLRIKPSINEDVVWITSSPPLSLLFALLRLNNKNIKVVGCDHTSTVYQKNYFFQKIRNKLLTLLNVMVSLNPQDQDYYFKNGINSVCIPNGIDFETLKKEKSNKKYLVFVGRFSDEKQPLKAIELFVNSELYNSNVILKMFGYGDLEKEIVKYIEINNCGDKVLIIKDETNPDIIYKDALALILTSKVEGFPMVLLEAISRNIPCLSFKIPYGPLNIIKENINGFFIEDSVDDFDEKIERIKNIDVESIYKTLEEYSEKNILFKWKSLIESFRE